MPTEQTDAHQTVKLGFPLDAASTIKWQIMHVFSSPGCQDAVCQISVQNRPIIVDYTADFKLDHVLRHSAYICTNPQTDHL